MDLASVITLILWCNTNPIWIHHIMITTNVNIYLIKNTIWIGQSFIRRPVTPLSICFECIMPITVTESSQQTKQLGSFLTLANRYIIMQQKQPISSVVIFECTIPSSWRMTANSLYLCQNWREGRASRENVSGFQPTALAAWHDYIIHNMMVTVWELAYLLFTSLHTP